MHTLGQQLISKLSDKGLGFIGSEKGVVYNFKSPATESTAEGSPILIHSAEAPFTSFDIFGKSTQSGTPSPENPAEIVSAGQSGQIKVDITGEAGIEPQSLILATQDGLPGIPVSGDDYTYIDSTGQKWIADSIEYRRDGKCVRVQRIGKETKVGGFNFTETPDYPGRYQYVGLSSNVYKNGSIKSLCNIANWKAWAVEPGDIKTNNWFSLNLTTIYFAPKGNITDWNAEKVNNLLNGIPGGVTVLGQLENPIETPLTPEEEAAFKALHTNEPTTTIMNDADAWMKVGYYTGVGIRRMVAEAVRINGERVR